MTVTWGPDAVSALERIRGRASAFSPAGAERLTTRLVDAVESLAHFPELGRVVPEFEIDQIRELIVGDYRVIYQVHAQTVEVHTVLHGRMDTSELRPGS